MEAPAATKARLDNKAGDFLLARVIVASWSEELRYLWYHIHIYDSNYGNCGLDEGLWNGMTVEKCTIPADGSEEEHPARANSPDIDRMMRNAHQASHFLKALSHETRLVLLYLLSEDERSVTDLENILALRQPAVSQQLARLRLDGLVSTRRDGKIIYYSIANEDIRRAIMLVYEVFCKEGSGTGRNLHPWQS